MLAEIGRFQPAQPLVTVDHGSVLISFLLHPPLLASLQLTLGMLPRGPAGFRALAAVARHNRACPTVVGVVPRFTHPTLSAPTLSRLGLFHARFNSTTGKDNDPSTQPPSIDSQNIPSDPDKLTKQHKKHKWRYSKHGELDPDFSGKHPWVASCLRLAISTAIGILVVGGILLIHDASTYTERHVGRVPVNPLSLHPRRGGPKNLPIIEVNIDDEEDEQKRAMKDKPRLVILGGGWGVSKVSRCLEEANIHRPSALSSTCLPMPSTSPSSATRTTSASPRFCLLPVLEPLSPALWSSLFVVSSPAAVVTSSVEKPSTWT